MIATLADIVAPLSVEAFREILRHRELHLFRGDDARRHAALLDWETLSEVVLSGAFPVRKLRVTRDGWVLPNLLYRDGDTPRRHVIEPLLQAGGSVIAYGLEPYVPTLTDLCAAVSSVTGDKVTAGAIATTGRAGALDLHYDDQDLLILQVEGSKRWMIQAEPFPDPIEGMAPVPGHADTPLLIDAVIEAGDWLFLPAGYRHRCETTSERSLHVGIFLHPLTAPRALDLLRLQLIGDPAARKPIRFDPDEAVAAERDLKQRLIDQITTLSLDDLMAFNRTSS